ncbi:hypothetical protein EG827_09280 [bacterium]|nr:hypothetical protein [bacterium]
MGNEERPDVAAVIVKVEEVGAAPGCLHDTLSFPKDSLRGSWLKIRIPEQTIGNDSYCYGAE